MSVFFLCIVMLALSMKIVVRTGRRLVLARAGCPRFASRPHRLPTKRR